MNWPAAPADPRDPGWAEVAALWDLEEGLDHLNNGSFGAVPRPVLEAQIEWRERMERNPNRFFRRENRFGLIDARHRAAEFVGADPEGVAFVSNATTGVNVVLAAAGLQPREEVLVTSHAYGAVRFAINRACERAGAVPVEVTFDAHDSDDDVVDALVAAVTGRTALAVVDHITSSTARELSITRIVDALHERDVPVLVDAAHAPGMVDVDVAALGAEAWVGNLHKWALAPRGTAVLWASPTWRGRMLPLVVSWDEDEGFPGAFDRPGTDDATAWLSVPTALDLHEHLDVGGRLRRRNAVLAGDAQALIADRLGVGGNTLWGSGNVAMRCIPLPERFGSDSEALYDRIAREAKAELAVLPWGRGCMLRVSAQAYVDPAAFARLGDWLAAN